MDNQQQYGTIENIICQQKKNIHLKNLNEDSKKYEQIIENAVNDIINGTSKKNENVNENTTTIKSGIYLIVNKINGKWYVGKTKRINRRWHEHRWLLKKNTHHSYKLQNDYNLYGINAFVYTVIEYVNIDYLELIEQKYLNISQFNEDIMYNVSFTLMCKCDSELLSKLHKGVPIKFTQIQYDFIKMNYSQYGPKYCASKLNLKIKQVYDIASRLNIKIKNIGVQSRIFSMDDIKFIKNNYATMGGSFCAKSLGFTPKQIQCRAGLLGIKSSAPRLTQYTNKDIEFIKTYYSTHGSDFCASQLGFTRRQISCKAQRLGIKIANKNI